jgi:sugar lactone lactonase YvrE
VYANERGAYERDLETGKQRRVASLPTDTLEVWPNPTGRWLGYLRKDGGLWLLDLDEGRRWRVSERGTTAVGWMPDGRLVAIGLLDRNLVAIDPGDRGTDRLVRRYGGGRPLWRDRYRFLTADRRGMVAVNLNVVGGRGAVTTVARGVRPLALSPDGREVLYATGPAGRKPRVVIADLERDKLGSRRVVFEGLSNRAAVSPQGFVAFSGRDRSNDGGTWILEGRGLPRRITRGQAESIAWSRDGSALVYVIDGTLFVRDLGKDRTIRLSERGTHVKGFAVVP